MLVLIIEYLGEEKVNSEYSRYFLKRDGEEKSTNFKRKYFDDCPKAKAFIKSQKKLNEKAIIELVKLYNEYCGK